MRSLVLLLLGSLAQAQDVDRLLERMESAGAERAKAARELAKMAGFGLHCDCGPIDQATVDRWNEVRAELRQQGRRAAPLIVPLLVEDVDRWGNDGAALLWVIGREAVPELCALLVHKDPRVRATAAQCLHEIGADAAAAVNTLLRALSDPDAEARRWALIALDSTGLNEERIVSAFVAGLEDAEPLIRINAARALLVRHRHRAAAEAVFWSPAGWAARCQMLLYLPYLYAGDPRTMPTLLEALGDPDDCIRQCARASLEKLLPRVWIDLKDTLESVASWVRKLLNVR